MGNNNSNNSQIKYKNHSLQVEFEQNSVKYYIQIIKNDDIFYVNKLICSPEDTYSSNGSIFVWDCCVNQKKHKKHPKHLKKLKKHFDKYLGIDAKKEEICLIFGEKEFRAIL